MAKLFKSVDGSFHITITVSLVMVMRGKFHTALQYKKHYIKRSAAGSVETERVRKLQKSLFHC